MDEKPTGKTPSGDVLEELRELGRNLRTIVQSVWESEERKKLEHDLETGLNEVYNSLSKATQDFAESPTGKTLKSDIEDLGQRIRSGEVETQVREEILSALRAANDGLRKAVASKPAATDTIASPNEESK
jgi:hypothetical protein